MPGIRYRQAKRLSKMVSEKPAPGNPSNAVSTSFCHVTKYRSYLAPGQAQSAVYSASGLGPGAHTLTIELTGTHNPNSGGSWIWVDAFEVVGVAPSPTP